MKANIKRLLVVLVLVAVTVLSAEAQRSYGGYGRNGRYDGGRMGYGSGWYGGVKFGMSVASVRSESSSLNGNRPLTGISVGGAAGLRMTPNLLLESGLYYIEKGGSSKTGNGKFTYELNYLEAPLLMKFCVFTRSRVTIQPYFGGYLGLGVGGSIKDYEDRKAFSSYKDGYFRRGDCGMRFGCGFVYSFLYAGIGYDLGLANIGQDQFDETRSRALVLELGISF